MGRVVPEHLLEVPAAEDRGEEDAHRWVVLRTAPREAFLQPYHEQPYHELADF